MPLPITQSKESMKVKDVINYLNDPPYKETIHMNGKPYDLCDYDIDTLKEMTDKLSKTQLSKLLGEVDTVCIQWNTLRLAPGNSIGAVARYQECKLLLEKLCLPNPSLK